MQPPQKFIFCVFLLTVLTQGAVHADDGEPHDLLVRVISQARVQLPVVRPRTVLQRLHTAPRYPGRNKARRLGSWYYTCTKL